MDAERGGEFVLAILGAETAGTQQGEVCAPEIEIESDRANYHSDDTESKHVSKVKTDMGQQSNKTIKLTKKQKAAMRKMDSVQEELSTLKNDIAEIKELLKGLVK
jgi:predicted translin family RNA/ssDNA-binding protein